MVLKESNMRRVKTEPTLSISHGEYMARKKREREEQVHQQHQQAAKRRALDPSAGRQEGDRGRRSFDPSKLPHSSHDKQQPVRRLSTESRHPSSVYHRPRETRPLSVAVQSSNNPHPPPAGHMHGRRNSSTADKSSKSLPHARALTQSNSGANVEHSIPIQAHTAEQKVQSHLLETAKLDCKISTDMHKDMPIDINFSTPTYIATPDYEDSLAERNTFSRTS